MPLDTLRDFKNKKKLKLKTSNAMQPDGHFSFLH